MYTDDLDGGSLYSSISSKADHGSFADYMNEIPYGTSPIPIRITGDGYRPQSKNYRAVLVQSILTLLCNHYHLCRPITLQVL